MSSSDDDDNEFLALMSELGGSEQPTPSSSSEKKDVKSESVSDKSNSFKKLRREGSEDEASEGRGRRAGAGKIDRYAPDRYSTSPSVPVAKPLFDASISAEVHQKVENRVATASAENVLKFLDCLRAGIDVEPSMLGITMERAKELQEQVKNENLEKQATQDLNSNPKPSRAADESEKDTQMQLDKNVSRVPALPRLDHFIPFFTILDEDNADRDGNDDSKMDVGSSIEEESESDKYWGGTPPIVISASYSLKAPVHARAPLNVQPILTRRAADKRSDQSTTKSWKDACDLIFSAFVHENCSSTTTFDEMSFLAALPGVGCGRGYGRSGWTSSPPSFVVSKKEKGKRRMRNENLYSKWQSLQYNLFDQKSMLWSPLQVPPSQISYSAQERASWQAIWTSLKGARHEELLAANKASRDAKSAAISSSASSAAPSSSTSSYSSSSSSSSSAPIFPLPISSSASASSISPTLHKGGSANLERVESLEVLGPFVLILEKSGADLDGEGWTSSLLAPRISEALNKVKTFNHDEVPRPWKSVFEKVLGPIRELNSAKALCDGISVACDHAAMLVAEQAFQWVSSCGEKTNESGLKGTEWPDFIDSNDDLITLAALSCRLALDPIVAGYTTLSFRSSSSSTTCEESQGHPRALRSVFALLATVTDVLAIRNLLTHAKELVISEPDKESATKTKNLLSVNQGEAHWIKSLVNIVIKWAFSSTFGVPHLRDRRLSPRSSPPSSSVRKKTSSSNRATLAVSPSISIKTRPRSPTNSLSISSIQIPNVRGSIWVSPSLFCPDHVASNLLDFGHWLWSQGEKAVGCVIEVHEDSADLGGLGGSSVSYTRGAVRGPSSLKMPQAALNPHDDLTERSRTFGQWRVGIITGYFEAGVWERDEKASLKMSSSKRKQVGFLAGISRGGQKSSPTEGDDSGDNQQDYATTQGHLHESNLPFHEVSWVDTLHSPPRLLGRHIQLVLAAHPVRPWPRTPIDSSMEINNGERTIPLLRALVPAVDVEHDLAWIVNKWVPINHSEQSNIALIIDETRQNWDAVRESKKGVIRASSNVNPTRTPSTIEMEAMVDEDNSKTPPLALEATSLTISSSVLELLNIAIGTEFGVSSSLSQKLVDSSSYFSPTRAAWSLHGLQRSQRSSEVVAGSTSLTAPTPLASFAHSHPRLGSLSSLVSMCSGVVSGVPLGSGLFSDAANAANAFPSYKSRAYLVSKGDQWFMPEFPRESPMGSFLQRLAFIGANFAINIGDNIKDRKAEELALKSEIGNLTLVRKTVESRVTALEAAKASGKSLEETSGAMMADITSSSTRSASVGGLQGEASPLRRTARPIRHTHKVAPIALLSPTFKMNENGIRYLFGLVAVRPPNLPTFSKDSRAVEVITSAHWQRVVSITDLLSVSCYLLWSHPFEIKSPLQTPVQRAGEQVLWKESSESGFALSPVPLTIKPRPRWCRLMSKFDLETAAQEREEGTEIDASVDVCLSSWMSQVAIGEKGTKLSWKLRVSGLKTMLSHFDTLKD